MGEDRPGKDPETAQGDELIAVGVVGGPWGVRGHVKVASLTDLPERFSPGSQLLLDDRPIHVQSSRSYKGGLVIKLREIDSRQAAEVLRGKLLQVPKDRAEPLPKGRYYHFQILDMQVWTKEEHFLGTVKEILTTGSNDVYVVRGDSKEVLIPALEDVVLEVDTEKGRMTVDLPEGLM